MRKGIFSIGVALLVVGLVILAMSLISVPYTTTEFYEVPKTDVIVDDSFSVPPRKS